MTCVWLDLNAAGDTLYVTLAHENAIAVVDVAEGEVEGLIPTHYYDVRVAGDGSTLIVSSGRGVGDAPPIFRDRTRSSRGARCAARSPS